MTKITQTTAFKTAVRYAVIVAAILLLGYSSIYWLTFRNFDKQLEDELRKDTSELMDSYFQGGGDALISKLQGRGENAFAEGRYYLLHLAANEVIAGNLIERPDELPYLNNGELGGGWIDDDFAPRGALDDDIFAAYIQHQLDDGSTLIVARGLELATDVQHVAETLYWVGIALVLGALTAFVMGITLGARIVSRMSTITQTANQIVAGDLSQRIELSNKNDEFDQLSISLNAMLDRIQQLMSGMREVSDNIAHDLRSPLTRLRSRLDVSLLEKRGATDYENVIQGSVAELDQIVKTFNALLSIAQLEAGNHRSVWEPIPLCALTAELVDLYQPAAEEKKQQILIEQHVDDVSIAGSRQLLAQLISNILDNSIKYTQPGGKISVSCKAVAEGVSLTIRDNGPGIPESQLENVMQRFVRLDSSRSTEGNGFGLSLASAICKLHEADFSMESSSPGVVTTINFPSLRTQ